MGWSQPRAQDSAWYSAGACLSQQGLTLFPPWTESPLKESMCAQVSGRTSSFTEHLMGRGRGGLSHHILHSNPLRTFTKHSCSPKAPGPHNAQPYWFPLLLQFPPRNVFCHWNMPMSISPNLLFLSLLSYCQLPIKAAYRHVQCSPPDELSPLPPGMC